MRWAHKMHLLAKQLYNAVIRNSVLAIASYISAGFGSCIVILQVNLRRLLRNSYFQINQLKYMWNACDLNTTCYTSVGVYTHPLWQRNVHNQLPWKQSFFRTKSLSLSLSRGLLPLSFSPVPELAPSSPPGTLPSAHLLLYSPHWGTPTKMAPAW